MTKISITSTILGYELQEYKSGTKSGTRRQTNKQTDIHKHSNVYRAAAVTKNIYKTLLIVLLVKKYHVLTTE